SRPPAIDIDEYPPPAPVAFQTRGGPLAGHCLSRPVSLEIPSRFGPRYCGQSALACAAASKKQKTTSATTNKGSILLNFMRSPFPLLRDPGRHSYFRFQIVDFRLCVRSASGCRKLSKTKEQRPTS